MTYEFECVDCKVIHEESRKIDERNQDSFCPMCGGVCNRIMFSKDIGHVYNCDGFYTTDYKRRGQ